MGTWLEVNRNLLWGQRQRLGDGASLMSGRAVGAGLVRTGRVGGSEDPGTQGLTLSGRQRGWWHGGSDSRALVALWERGGGEAGQGREGTSRG